MIAPKLRFKEFDGDWSALKYKDVLTIKYGKDHKSLDEGDIPVYGTGGVMRYVDQYLYEGESILIGRKGTIDQPKYVNEKFWTVDTLFYTEIKKNALPLFLFQHALQVNWLGLNEATGVPSLNTTSINNVDIYLPSNEEQTKIASFLSAVDEKISQLTQKHELLSQYKQGMMQKLFSQQLRFKADDGSEFGEWEETTLGEIGTFKSGQGFPEQFQGGKDGIPFFKVSDMNILGNEKIMKVANNYVNSEAITKMKAKVIDNEAIIFAKVGAAIFLERKRLAKNFLIDNNMMAYLSNQKTNIMFLKQFLDNIKLSKFVQVGALPSYNSSDLAIIPISLPCLEEQTKIANFLSAIDQKIDVVSEQLEQAKLWKKGLLQQMFV
ncbi:restriction endonuclease S subunits-like protein [Acinetobacter baumannii]|uniref:restriction endonuclease subunit S n=1 Tax=Acinetobacter baumannii TaxID=470 RepID=UPI000CE3A4F9|nr:restriction endonuclease subunit S [Acinetobacter baumannii]MBF9227850.1 restriction endonuclease subunit S [Acinetobacter baumannii]MCG6641028.1 restriction endonuclease subunit S [Acinetobacter baumannii]MCZ3099536.1 restriction endonuclease subunit S [Acinetobacter baumannii]MCZ3195434.1 restriction endonuclease subunit S [Acinetobacter baumannii]MDA3536827.1 restriction endonuclease subunit S [Acinetobacter baumannii]